MQAKAVGPFISILTAITLVLSLPILLTTLLLSMEEQLQYGSLAI